MITADRDQTGYSDKDATVLFFIVPDIAQVIPQRGSTVGEEITIIGTGYDKIEQVTIHFGTTQTITTAMTDNSGTFSATFKVTTQPSGKVVITGVGKISGGIATNTFSLQGIWYISPTSGIVGEVVTVFGTGYQAGEEVHIGFSTQATITTVVADSPRGDFVVTFIVNTEAQGTKVITATGTNPLYLMDTDIFILIPHIVLVPTSGYAGVTTVSIYGTGYPYNGAYTIRTYLDQSQQTPNKTPSVYGTFTKDFLIPSNWTGGKRNIRSATYQGLTYILMGEATEVFTILPKITTVNPSAGPVGQVVTVSGKYFAESEVVRIDFGTQFTIATTTADPGCPNGGGFSCTFIVGTYSSGGKVITATGFANNLMATSTFEVKPNNIILNPASGILNAIVTVTGNGYTQGEVITLDFGTQVTIATATANSQGIFSATFIVNTQAYGSRMVTATGETSNLPDTEPFTILPTINGVIPPSGPVGTIVIVKGEGFWESPISGLLIDFGASVGLGPNESGNTDVNGSYVGSFTVNKQSYGTKVITLTMWKSGMNPILATSIFVITSRISLVSPTTGIVSRTVTVQGTGFSNEIICISFGKTETIATAQVNTNGTFSTTFRVDTQDYGCHVITARNSTFATSTFFIFPDITLLNPLSGKVGEVVTLTGRGYKGSETLHITFGTHITITTVTVSSDGTFSVTFVVSTQVAQTRVITAYGIESGVSSTTIFQLKARIYLVQPSSGISGDPITVEGCGYSDAPEVVNIHFGNHPDIKLVSPGTNGTFSTTFAVDAQVSGIKVITAIDYNSGECATSIFTITAGLTEPEPKSGVVGTVVTIKGVGYAETGEVVHISFGTHKTITTTIVVNGTFSTTFVVDTQAYGTTQITGVGVSSGVICEKTFVILSDITLISPASGPVGTEVTVWGRGYDQSGTLTISFGTNPTITTVNTNISLVASTPFLSIMNCKGKSDHLW